MTETEDAWIALAHMVEPADPAACARIERWGPTEFLSRLQARGTGLRHEEGMLARWSGYSAERARERADRIGARIITRGSPEWPRQVDALGPTAPFAMWVSGAADLRLIALRSVSIVGARASTPYGDETARSWAAELASERWTVISGAAFGIDAAAHRGALAAGGVTIAVVAGGVDVPYPRAHAPLLDAIADQGLVISEVPPGESVRRQRFLSRNRMIAALGRATVVVEAAVRSGTMATAHAASTLMRPVLAVPGPVTSPMSAGCHRMMQEGMAIVVGECADVIAALDLSSITQAPLTPAPGSPAQSERDALRPGQTRVLDSMPSRGWSDADALIRASALAPADVLAGLTELVMLGWVEEGPLGCQLLRVPPAESGTELPR